MPHARMTKKSVFSTLPGSASAFMACNWAKIAPYYRNLRRRRLSAANVHAWLVDWSRLNDLLSEAYARLNVATTVNTADRRAEKRHHTFLERIFPAAEAEEQKLKEKLLRSGLEPEGFSIPLQKLRAEAEIFRQKNLPLMTAERKLATEYEKVIGAQTVRWEGRELTVSQLRPIFQDQERTRRERAWRLSIQRQLADREAINGLWGKFLTLRRRMAANADFSNYLDFRWRQLLRFDYTPADCAKFHEAIAAVATPAAARRNEQRRRQLGLDALRPWDLDVDPLGRLPLRPFRNGKELARKAGAIFRRVNPRLGAYFQILRDEQLLDLDNRKNKAPGGYCTTFPAVERPFIFMNAVGLQTDMETILHEAGHCFHVFERAHLPYQMQKQTGMEFAEVASMAMELLASPYLSAETGGFYSPADAARANIEHLEQILLFWPYMAVVDAFQHWVYRNPEAALRPENCDTQWAELWDRFMRGIDWTGLEEEKKTGWHRKLHIHMYPFYYVEYGLAQLGAVQVWAKALKDQAAAVAAYRRALALGGTVGLPDLFAAAGARFAFDPDTLQRAVSLIESKIQELEAATE